MFIIKMLWVVFLKAMIILSLKFYFSLRIHSKVYVSLVYSMFWAKVIRFSRVGNKSLKTSFMNLISCAILSVVIFCDEVGSTQTD